MAPGIVFAASKPFRQNGHCCRYAQSVRVNNRLGRVAERSTCRLLDQSAILRHKAKYGERVLYARARSVVMRRNLPAVTSETYGSIHTTTTSCVNTDANIPIGVAGASRCGHYCFDGPWPPRNSRRWAVITSTATALPVATGGPSCVRPFKEESLRMTSPDRQASPEPCDADT